MITYDEQQPFNEANVDGMLPDGCGLFERYYNFGAYVDFCGLSTNPNDFENVQTLYEKNLKVTKDNNEKISQLETEIDDLKKQIGG